MICCVDVAYRVASVRTAAVAFVAWTDAAPALERVHLSPSPPAAYEPGRFYLRELPHLLAVLAEVPDVETVVIDGYAWLGPDHAGLGAHLFAALGIPVIGVAKTRYAGAEAIELLRGASRAPLYVTAAGCELTAAADHIRAMHGPFRLPTLIKRADSLARAPG